jgi:hypothetical protein
MDLYMYSTWAKCHGCTFCGDRLEKVVTTKNAFQTTALPFINTLNPTLWLDSNPRPFRTRGFRVDHCAMPPITPLTLSLY